MKNKLLIIVLLLATLLRLFALNNFPAGINADEAAIGYNAYSLLETGRDEHGSSWPLAFRSFDDYKPGIYFYLVLPFVKFLGLNTWAVRLPSALLGVLSVYLTYLLANTLIHQKLTLSSKKKTWEIDSGVIAAFLLAISPWHLQFSRGGWEVNTATTFLLLGLVFFFQGLKNAKFFLLTSFFFVLCLYTYHSMRVVVPLIFVYLFINYLAYFKQSLTSKQNLSYIIVAAILGVVLLYPLAKQTLAGSTSARFSGVSIFAQSGPLWAANELRGMHQGSSLLPKLLHNQYYNYALQFFLNVASHYSDPFLFFSGDVIARSHVPGMGQSYLWTLPFFAFGIWYLFKLKPQGWGLILYWFVIGSFAASLTFQSPHALRAQNIVVPLVLLITFGLVNLTRRIIDHSPKILYYIYALVLILIIPFSFGRYLNLYYNHYPKEESYAWQYGFDQLTDYLKENYSKYDQIIVTTTSDQPYILLAFYLKYPPQRFQQELVFSEPDEFGFSTGTSFGKFIFKKIEASDFNTTNSLVIVGKETSPEGLIPIYEIRDLGNQSVFKIFSGSQNIALK